MNYCRTVALISHLKETMIFDHQRKQANVSPTFVFSLVYLKNIKTTVRIMFFDLFYATQPTLVRNINYSTSRSQYICFSEQCSS